MIPHRLTGYDKATERLVFAHELSLSQAVIAREIAGVAAGDHDAIGVYVLSEEQAERVAGLVGKDINTDLYEWCFEPMAVRLPATVV